MQTKYIVGLVALAVAITIGVAFVIYKNWGAIKGLYTKSKAVVKDKFAKIVPRPVKKVTPAEIFAKVEEDPVLVEDVVNIHQADIAANKNIVDTVQKTEQVVKQEATIKKSQGTPLASTITWATKYRKIADEKEASKKYNEILKKIETEKAKGAVLLSAVRAEQQKTQKLKLMDSLDMELDYGSNVAVQTPIRISKRGAELFVKTHITSV